MSYLLNYKNWRTLHESMSLNEALDPNDLPYMTTIPSVKLGNEVDALIDGQSILSFDKDEHSAAIAILNKVVGPQAIPNMRVGFNTNTSAGNAQKIFGLVLAGIGQNAGSFDSMKDTDTAAASVPNLGLTLERGESIQLYGKATGVIDTQGTSNSKSWSNTGKVGTTTIDRICGYINAFNLQNCASGDCTQYDPTKILADKNSTD